MSPRTKPSRPRSRPRTKFAVGDRVRVSMSAPAAYRGQMGRVVEIAGRGLYLVEVEDGDRARLYSWWLEPHPQ